MSGFTKEELRQMFKEFLYVIGSDLPERHIIPAWKRFCELKERDKFQTDLDALADAGYVRKVRDSTAAEWRYEPTEKGLASRKRGELERLGV
jgi:hypothetical protein